MTSPPQCYSAKAKWDHLRKAQPAEPQRRLASHQHSMCIIKQVTGPIFSKYHSLSATTPISTLMVRKKTGPTSNKYMGLGQHFQWVGYKGYGVWAFLEYSFNRSTENERGKKGKKRKQRDSRKLEKEKERKEKVNSWWWCHKTQKSFTWSILHWGNRGYNCWHSWKKEWSSKWVSWAEREQEKEMNIQQSILMYLVRIPVRKA